MPGRGEAASRAPRLLSNQLKFRIMKKFLYLLFLLPLGLLNVSCDDDDKVPDVDLQANVSGGVVVNNTVYVVKGEPLTVDAINLVNHTGKDGALGVVTYSLDYMVIGQSLVAPYGFELNTSNLAVGPHFLTAEMPVYVVDYPICFGVFSININVVEDASELPGEPAPTVLSGLVKEK